MNRNVFAGSSLAVVSSLSYVVLTAVKPDFLKDPEDKLEVERVASFSLYTGLAVASAMIIVSNISANNLYRSPPSAIAMSGFVLSYSIGNIVSAVKYSTGDACKIDKLVIAISVLVGLAIYIMYSVIYKQSQFTCEPCEPCVIDPEKEILKILKVSDDEKEKLAEIRDSITAAIGSVDKQLEGTIKQNKENKEMLSKLKELENLWKTSTADIEDRDIFGDESSKGMGRDRGSDKGKGGGVPFRDQRDMPTMKF